MSTVRFKVSKSEDTPIGESSTDHDLNNYGSVPQVEIVDGAKGDRFGKFHCDFEYLLKRRRSDAYGTAHP